MNDILFGNNNTEVIKRLSKRYFKKNRIRNLAAILAIMLTAFLFTSITSLVFSMSSSIQLSMQMQKGSKADGDIRYLTEEQYQERKIVTLSRRQDAGGLLVLHPTLPGTWLR